MRMLPLIAVLLLLAPMARAADIAVAAGADLQTVIGGANPGDHLTLAAGVYGAVQIDRALILDCAAGAVLDGAGKGTVVTITASDVTLRGCEVRGSGHNNQSLDSGIKITKSAQRALIANNTLIDNMHGVDFHGGKDGVARGNTIIGRQNKRMNENGNGFYVWNTPGLVIENNTVRYGRDGIFSNASKQDTYRNNLFRDLRFAVHYMYTNDSEVSGNISIGNHLGFAIMFSDRVLLKDNLSLNDRSHGVMLNFANKSDIIGNYARGAEKCTFIYNANRNLILGNRFEGCHIGVHFTAGSEKNAISGNTFIGNQTQVKYVGTRHIEWSLEGRGNYWSDHPAFDLNGDGFADSPFRPNDLMDSILWSQPAAGLLLGSPAVQLIRWSQSSFPATLPGGVVDSHPLMVAPQIAVPDDIAAMAAEVAGRWQKATIDDPELEAETTH